MLKGAKIKFANYNPAKDSAVISSIQKAKKAVKAGNWPRLIFLEDRRGNSGQGRPAVKRYLHKLVKGQVPWTFWADDDYETPMALGSQSWDHSQSGHSQLGLNELDAILGKGHGFQTVKPMRLFRKLIQIWCPPGGLVVDPFAGSGTTGHAVLELNKETSATRRFVLIEQGRVENDDRYARSITAERLKRVITGKWASGVQPALGSGFRFSMLTRKVDAKAVLNMAREEMIDLLLSCHWDKDSRNRPSLVKLVHEGYKHLIARDADQNGYFLLWRGADDTTTLDIGTHDEIVKEAKAAKLKVPYNIYARYEDYQSEDVRFFKIPDRVLMHLGISEYRDSFNEVEEFKEVAL